MMMPALLRLYEDTFAGDTALDAPLPAAPRMVFVVHGAATVEGRRLHDGEAWFGEGACALAPAGTGVTCWRFELVSPAGGNGKARGPGIVSPEKLAGALRTPPGSQPLVRRGPVAFPPPGPRPLHTP